VSAGPDAPETGSPSPFAVIGTVLFVVYLVYWLITGDATIISD
jgi:hypothetical protein